MIFFKTVISKKKIHSQKKKDNKQTQKYKDEKTVKNLERRERERERERINSHEVFRDA